MVDEGLHRDSRCARRCRFGEMERENAGLVRRNDHLHFECRMSEFGTLE